MAEGHTDSSGKFHPHNKNSENNVSSDQVEQKEPESQMNSNDVEKLKKRDS